MADVAYIPGEPGHERRPALGYAMVITAALLFALNGTVSKVVLQSGISPLELTQVRDDRRVPRLCARARADAPQDAPAHAA